MAASETSLAETGPALRPTANWRVAPEVVQSVGESLTDTLWQRGFAWFFLICGYGYYFLIARRYEVAEASMMAHFKAILLIFLSHSVLSFLYRRLLNRVEIGPGLRRLQTKVPTERACPVSVEIRQQGAVTGYDEGYAWIEDGTFFFKGLQTVFRLNREDVPPTSFWPRSKRPRPGRFASEIPVPVGGRDVSIKLRMIDPFEDYHARRRSAKFSDEVSTWLSERPKGWLESLLPPVELHPSLRASARFRHEGLVGAFILAGLDMALLFGTPWRLQFATLHSFGIAIALAGGVVLLALAVKLAWAEWNTVNVRREIDARPTLA